MPQEQACENAEVVAALRRTPIINSIRQWVMPAVWVAVAFVCAGRFGWVRGWICVATQVLCLVAAHSVARRRNPALAEARTQWRRTDTKPFDRILLGLYLPLTFVQPSVAGLDAVRFGWSSMPFWTVYPGVLLFMASVAVVGLVMAENPHAEPTVRIQTDRAHRVVRTGPYRLVRHPMYAAAIFMYPATALMLGSMWSLAIAGVIAILLVVRTSLEDKTLIRELPGYEEFTRETRYRLVPGMW